MHTPIISSKNAVSDEPNFFELPKTKDAACDDRVQIGPGRSPALSRGGQRGFCGAARSPGAAGPHALRSRTDGSGSRTAPVPPPCRATPGEFSKRCQPGLRWLPPQHTHRSEGKSGRQQRSRGLKEPDPTPVSPTAQRELYSPHHEKRSAPKAPGRARTPHSPRSLFSPRHLGLTCSGP